MKSEKIKLKKQVIVLEIIWNPETTVNPTDWDWNDLLDVGPYESAAEVRSGPEQDIEEELDEEDINDE